jgi:anti-sigma factor RsiW
MDHETTREQLELAAVEPGGIDRLIAGDTPTAQAVAAHLAGCSACTEDLARLERTSRLIGAVVREEPPADLRERTLAMVRELGRPRDASARPVPLVSEPAPVAPMNLAPIAARRNRRRAAAGWIVAIAAAVVLSVATTSILVGGRVDQQLAQQTDTIHTLEEVTTATLRVTSAVDARHVVLSGTSDPALTGSLVFSPSTSELVVVATGLTPPPAGQEYRCWVEHNGQRQRVGKMFFSEGLAYWIGPAPAIAGVSGGASFGVSLVDAAGTTIDSPPVIDGSL